MIGILLWVLILFYHEAGVVMGGNFTASMSFEVGDLRYRFVQIFFLVVHGILLSRLFSNIEKLHVTTLLWRLFMIGMGGVVLILLITFGNRLMEDMTMLRYFQAFFLVLGYYALVIFLLSGLFIFRRFILFPRTRGKLLMWQLFLVLLGMSIVLYLVRWAWMPPVGVVIALFLVYVLLGLVLSANVRWIPYLNFNQKLRALGMFVLLEIVAATYLVAGDRLPREMGGVSPDAYLPIETLTFLVIFVMVYSGFAILVLFFQLPTSSVFEKSKVEIASFSKINQAIQSNLDFTEIIGSMLEAAMLETGARAGWVEWLNAEGIPQLRNRVRIADEDLNLFRESVDLTDKVLRDQKFLLIRNLRKHKAFRTANTRFRSLLGVPVVSSSRSFGVLYLVNDLVNAFEDVSVQAVVGFAEQAGIALENAQLIKNSIEVERYQEQLKIAQEVQSKLLPTHLPQNDRIQIVALSENADEVGGDYFDVSQHKEHLFRVAIADVSGKGTTAAFYMAEVKGIFHALTQLSLSPRELVTTANMALSHCLQQGFFVTMTYLEIDVRRRVFELVRAGHTPTFYYTASDHRVQAIREGTLGLGLVRSTSFREYIQEPVEVQYEPGDMLVLYTDGLIEARNPEGEEFGYDRFSELILAHAKTPVEELTARVVEAVKIFSNNKLDDDYTVLTIRLL